MTKLIAPFLALLGGLPTQAQQSAKPAPPPPFEELYKMPAVYSVPGSDKVQVQRDIVYKSAETPDGKIDLRLDVYTPAGAKAGDRFPGVILISGGGAGDHDWRDAGVYQSYGRILGASGFIALTFSKRYQRGADGTSNGLEDFQDLVHYVRSHSAEIHVDAYRLASWAFSGGGYLLSPALGGTESFTRAVVCFYCILDAGSSVKSEDDRRKVREKLSPLAQIEGSQHAVPPILIGRAGFDSQELNGAIDHFVAEALAKNLSIEVMNHPEGRHGFDILDPDARSREIIQRAIEFLKLRLQ